MAILLTFILYSLLIIVFSHLIKVGAKYRYKTVLKNKYFVIAITIAGIVAALRGTTGSDSLMYIDLYERSGNIGRGIFELGVLFRGVVVLMNKMGFPYQVFFFLTNAICSYFFIKMLNELKFEIDYYVASFIYISDLYFFSFNGLRQAIAISICIYAMVLYYNEKKLKSLIFIGVAFLFHISAMICLFVIVAKELYTGKHYKLFSIISVIVAVLFVSNRPLLGHLADIITGRTYYGGYFTRDAETYSTPFRFFIKNTIYLLLPLLSFRSLKRNKEIVSITVVMIIGFIIGSLQAVTNTQVGRLGYYFMYLYMIVLPYLAYNGIYIGKYKVRRLDSSIIICVGVYGMFIYNYFIKMFSEVVPYKIFL